MRFHHGDGSWRIMEGVAVNRLADPAVAGIVINARDITERRRLEEQLRHAQKMEAIGQLAGGVAHDFNNLLTAILGYCHLMLDEMPEDDPLRDDLLEIEAAGDRAASLTRQLLAFSRRQMLQPQMVDINALVRQLEKLLRRLISEDVELVTALAPDLHRGDGRSSVGGADSRQPRRQRPRRDADRRAPDDRDGERRAGRHLRRHSRRDAARPAT